MKIVDLKNIASLLLLALLSTFVSCGDDDDNGASPGLVATWSASSVLLNDFDVTMPTYENFTITFRSDGTYITSGGTPVFTDQGGFWSITSETGSQINITLDDIAASVSFTDDLSTAVLNFTANGKAIGARTSGLEGNYVINLQKKQ
ncbi:hypothetical protein FNH22_03900 [Fulvivirga sp. M361]|uniref:hypothetical protein n=1 Tax=Fulvivirga sp. M361 TaxID=2594266 RepID=UPI00117999E4|nr:hypothetical protein [Fulvivirga sp. M361]TRX61209.1 hypothetical protein FNH22_03900 [Fulvivirga sp. M361]